MGENQSNLQGYLYKRGGLRKNWLKRWFVLARTPNIIFMAYFDHSEVNNKTSVPKGVIPLAQAQLSSDDAAFQKTGHRHSMLIQTSSREYEIYAESLDDIDQWRRALAAAISAWASTRDLLALASPHDPSSSSDESFLQRFQGKAGLHRLWLQYLAHSTHAAPRDADPRAGPPAPQPSPPPLVFGGDLSSQVRVWSDPDGALRYELPHFLAHCFAALRQSALNQVGIFRLSSSRAVLDDLAEQYNRGEAPALGGFDPHVAACLLKAYFRELRDPLMTFRHYGEWLAVEQGREPDRRPRRYLGLLRQQLEKLPRAHLVVLFELCRLLLEFDAHAHASNMNKSNLAIVFTPNLFRLPDLDMLRDIKDAPFLLSVTRTLLDAFPLLFQPEIRALLAHQPLLAPQLAPLLVPLAPAPLQAQEEAPPEDPARVYAEMDQLLTFVGLELSLQTAFDSVYQPTLAGYPPDDRSHSCVGNLFDNQELPINLLPADELQL